MTRLRETCSSQSIENIALFETLPKEAVARIQSRCAWRYYQAGESIMHYLDQSNEVFFITEGDARVSIYSADGKAVTFSDLKAGDWFGEIAAIDGAPRSAGIEARTRCCIASLSRTAFLELIASEPRLALNLLRHFAEMIRGLTTRIYEFSALDVSNRTRAELLRLARLAPRQGRSASISPMPTHSEIASRISTHREAVTRELNALSRLGLVERRGATLIVTDVEQLEVLVGDVKCE